MDISTPTIEYERSEHGHHLGTFDEDNNDSQEYDAQALAETYSVLLMANGEVVINGKTHTWQEVIDEDLDNILELQRKLHRCYWAIDITAGAVRLKEAQEAAVNGWSTRTARERVGLS